MASTSPKHGVKSPFLYKCYSHLPSISQHHTTTQIHPWKLTWNPKNHLVEKENRLNQTSMTLGFQPLISQGVSILKFYPIPVTCAQKKIPQCLRSSSHLLGSGSSCKDEAWQSSTRRCFLFLQECRPQNDPKVVRITSIYKQFRPFGRGTATPGLGD